MELYFKKNMELRRVSADNLEDAIKEALPKKKCAITISIVFTMNGVCAWAQAEFVPEKLEEISNWIGDISKFCDIKLLHLSGEKMLSKLWLVCD